jgi:hypothetical protein
MLPVPVLYLWERLALYHGLPPNQWLQLKVRTISWLWQQVIMTTILTSTGYKTIIIKIYSFFNATLRLNKFRAKPYRSLQHLYDLADAVIKRIMFRKRLLHFVVPRGCMAPPFWKFGSSHMFQFRPFNGIDTYLPRPQRHLFLWLPLYAYCDRGITCATVRNAVMNRLSILN